MSELDSEGPSPWPGRAVAGALCGAAVLAWVFNRPPDGGDVWRHYSVMGAAFNGIVTGVACAAAYVCFPSSPRKPRAFRAIGATFAVGFLMVLLELPVILLGFDYAPVLVPDRANTFLGVSQEVNRADPDLVHVHWPDSSWEGEVVGNLVWRGIPNPRLHQVRVKYDSNGFRNDREYERAEVAVIGDSFVEAAILPNEDGVVAQLAGRLDTEVVNLGQAAYGLRQELAVLKRHALPLEPRLVLWFLFGGNDFRDVPRYDEHLAGSTAVAKMRPLKERLFLRNGLLALSGLTTPARSEPGSLAARTSAWTTDEDGTRRRMYFGDGCPPVAPAAWRVATETLAEANALCNAAGVRFVVIHLPRKYRVYKHHVEFEPGVVAESWTLNDVPDRLAAWCADASIAYLDLSPRLEEAVAAGKHPYFFEDVHWNASGHALAADAVVELLETLDWKPEGR